VQEFILPLHAIRAAKRRKRRAPIVIAVRFEGLVRSL
jgi:hypothetical protein